MNNNNDTSRFWQTYPHHVDDDGLVHSAKLIRGDRAGQFPKTNAFRFFEVLFYNGVSLVSGHSSIARRLLLVYRVLLLQIKHVLSLHFLLLHCLLLHSLVLLVLSLHLLQMQLLLILLLLQQRRIRIRSFGILIRVHRLWISIVRVKQIAYRTKLIVLRLKFRLLCC